MSQESFESQIHAARRQEYEARLAEFKSQFEIAKQKKLAELKEKRKSDRRGAYFKEIEMKKKREEEERAKKEEEETKRKLDEQYEKQRVREREVEERLREREAKERAALAEREKPKEAPYRPRALQDAANPKGDDLSWSRGQAASDDRRDFGRERGEFGGRGGERTDRGDRADFGGRGERGGERDLNRERKPAAATGADEGGWRRGPPAEAESKPDR